MLTGYRSRTTQLSGVVRGNEVVAVALEAELGILVPANERVEEVEGDFEVPSLLNKRHLHVGVLVPKVEDVSDVERAVLGVEGGVRQSIQVLWTFNVSPSAMKKSLPLC